METLLGRYKNLLVLMAVLVAQFIALAVQVRRPLLNGADGRGEMLLRRGIVGLVAPPERVVVKTGSGVRGFWGNYLDLRHTRDENDALREEVNRLRLEQAGLIEDARQGQRLQALLAFRERYVSRTEPAQVIGTAGSDQARVLYLDKGSDDGVEIDQPVITPDGIVGKIKEVFPHTSQVLEINDQTSGAGVLLQTTRLRGVLRGNSYGQPQVIDILPDERIKAGEQVVTSGGDQIFPRGLPVGTVEKIVTDPEREPYVDIVVKPAANLQHLEEVLVVTGTTDELPATTKKDLAHSQAVAAVTAEQQRASDILAEKLPGMNDPNDPQPDASAEQKPTGGEEVGRPIQPPQPLHADRYSPNSAPPASQLTPGKAPALHAYVPELPAAEGGNSTPKPKAKPVVKTDAVTAGDRVVVEARGTSPELKPPAVVVSRPAAEGAASTSTSSLSKAPVAGIKPTSGAAAPGPAPAAAETNGTAPKHAAPLRAPGAGAAVPPKPISTYVEPKWVGDKRVVSAGQPQ